MATATADLTEAERRIAAGKVHWTRKARPEQRPPKGDWYIWFLRGGRGAGKTRSGAEWLADEIAFDEEGDVSAVIAPTFGEGRDKCVEGPSGLREALRRRGIAHNWNRSIGELWLRSGAKVIVDEAYTGAVKVQGENLKRAWCDELRNWRANWGEQAWDESLLPAVRVGSHPRIVVTSTPGRTPLVRRLMADETIAISHMTTFDNQRNLAPQFIEQMRRRYEGTRLGKQELYGQLIEDVEGALWRYEMIQHADEFPYGGWQRPPHIGVDPADGGSGSDHAYTVSALGMDHNLYVIEHGAFDTTPYAFAREVIDIAARHHGVIKWERNHGGQAFLEVVRRAMKDMGVTVPLNDVWASKSKLTRAEPVAGLYENGRVFHVGTFPELEEQMTSWTGSPREKSPDRLDSLVWSLADFTGYSFGPPLPDHLNRAVPYSDTEEREYDFVEQVRTGYPSDGAVPWR